MRVWQYIYATARMTADIAFPPRCPSCRLNVTADGNFCPDCFRQLRMISAPMCNCCGIPFVVMIEADAKCPECLDTPPEFSKARSVMVYDAISAPLVSAIKFHDQWASIGRHAHMMTATGSSLLKDADILIPVPLHWRRLMKRKFNQSALLAHGISKTSGVPVSHTVLKRAIYTKPQMRLDRKERLANVKHAFAAHDYVGEQVKGKIVVLVDDVVTTGATANACAMVLKKAGAKEVRVLSLARTVKE